MRAENILIGFLSFAQYIPNKDRSIAPAASWISNISKHITMKSELQNKILENLYQKDFDYPNFIMKVFRHELPNIFDTATSCEWCIEAISVSIRSGNEFVKDQTKDFLTHWARKEWMNLFVKYLKDLTDPEKPEIYLPENGPHSPKTIPFLGKFEPKPNPGIANRFPGECMDEDDVPF